MYETIEVTRPTPDYIKNHGPSLKNILKLTEMGFQVCHPDLPHANSPKLGQVLDLISTYYGFNSFGALKLYLEQDDLEIQPIQDTKNRVIQKIADIAHVELSHPIVSAYEQTLTSYISNTMLPNSLNLSFDPDVDDSLLAMRYLQIRVWHPIMIKLIKNPQYKIDDADIYTYSEISRMIRLNIINNLLPFANDALIKKESSFTVPFSVFFGGRLTVEDLQNNISQYFNSAVIGSDLLSVSCSHESDLFIPLQKPLLANKNLPQHETIISSILLDFKITPRLEAMLFKFSPTKSKPSIKVMNDLISKHTEPSINLAVKSEIYEKVAADNVLRQIINNLAVLNPYLTKPKAAFYQAEPENSPSNLVWRKYIVGYAHYILPMAIKVANSVLSNQKARKSNIYFDENGLIMFNLDDSIVINDRYSELLSNYDFSLIINLMIVNKMTNEIDIENPSNLNFRLMTAYMLGLFQLSNFIPPLPETNRASILRH